jgi:hypothetical protein
MNPLDDLRGIAKELFRELGGGEAFIRKERNSFSNERSTNGSTMNVTEDFERLPCGDA